MHPQSTHNYLRNNGLLQFFIRRSSLICKGFNVIMKRFKKHKRKNVRNTVLKQLVVHHSSPNVNYQRIKALIPSGLGACFIKSTHKTPTKSFF